MSTAEGEAYLEKHKIQQALSAALSSVMDTRCDKPLAAIARMLLAAEQGK